MGLTLHAVLCAFCDPVISHLFLVRCFSSDSRSAHAPDPVHAPIHDPIHAPIHDPIHDPVHDPVHDPISNQT